MEVIIIGDLVQLKSGGPRMTVKRIIGQSLDTWQGKTNEQVLKIQGYKDGDMVCIWFEENKLNEGVFPLEALQKV
ncbi:MAG: YodC family protein [Bacteroidota bacterium]|nr:YodC family protein [Bacteroidota bacterium]